MRFLAVLVTSIFILVGCSSPKPIFNSLNVTPIPQAAPSAKNTRIMVGPVTLPATFDRPQLVIQNIDNTVQVYEYHRWANTLKGDVSDVIASNVAQTLMISNVWSFSQSTQTSFDYQVFVDVQNIDAKLADRVVVDVLWTIKPAFTTKSFNKTTVSKTSLDASEKSIAGRSLVKEQVTGDGINALVAAQSRAFAKVGQEIARSIP